MKFKIFTASIIAMFIILVSSSAFASTGTVELKASTNQVKKGDTFTVTLSASSEDGINGIDTKYTYDQEKLELVSEGVVDSSNWSSLGTAPDITIICNSTEKIKNADIYALKFKVKDNVAVGSKITIGTNEILLDTDAQTDSEVKVAAKSVEVTVIEKSSEETKEDEPSSKDDVPSKEDEPSSKDDVPSKEDEPSSKDDVPNKDDGQNSKDDEPSAQDKQETNDNKQNTDSVQKTNSQASETKTTTISSNKTEETRATKTLPKTGANFIVIIISIVAFIILAIVFYKKYSYIKNIK